MNAPIGVFDSGLGGLTVVRRIRERLPQEQIVYVADQAHVPYGGRELSEVCGFACGISRALLDLGCRALVMACNISSATALSVVQSDHPQVPILGVVLPGAEAAQARTCRGRIGVLATEGTVRSGAYTRALHALDPQLFVREVACPAFVPLVEAGREASSEAITVATDYLTPLAEAGVDTVVLGCTHYPFLTPILQHLQPNMEFVDPAEQTVTSLALALESEPAFAGRDPDQAPDLLLTTGDPAIFTAQVRRFLPDVCSFRTGAAHWNDGALCLHRTS